MYVLNVDGSVTPLSAPTSAGSGGPLPQSVTTPNGVVHPVRVGSEEGNVDSASESSTRAFTLTVPAGTDLSSYQWMVVQSPEALGTSRMEVTDSVSGGPSHVIAWNTLSSIGTTVFTRVGSCLAWHGYRTGTLTMLVTGHATSFSARLLK